MTHTDPTQTFYSLVSFGFFISVPTTNANLILIKLSYKQQFYSYYFCASSEQIALSAWGSKWSETLTLNVLHVAAVQLATTGCQCSQTAVVLSKSFLAVVRTERREGKTCSDMAERFGLGLWNQLFPVFQCFSAAKFGMTSRHVTRQTSRTFQKIRRRYRHKDVEGMHTCFTLAIRKF